jgi:AbrB family looped-hinge helix DNA binding protein
MVIYIMKSFKLTEKYQVTIPKKVRSFLHLKKGDCVEYKIDNDIVILHKIPQVNNEYLIHLDSMLEEWSSFEDEESYNDL